MASSDVLFLEGSHYDLSPPLLIRSIVKFQPRLHIETVVDADPMIFHQSVDMQPAKIIIESLLGLNPKTSPFIIDGLNESHGIDIQSGLVRSLAAAFQSLIYVGYGK